MSSSRSCRTVALSFSLLANACAVEVSAGVTLAALNAEDCSSDEVPGISLLQLRAHRSREALVQALRAASSAGTEAEAKSSERAVLRAEAAEAVLSVAQADAQAGAEADLGSEMTEQEAQTICAQIPGCKGFTMQYQPTSDSPVEINMKDKEVLLQVQSAEGSDTSNKSGTPSSVRPLSNSAIKGEIRIGSGSDGLVQPTNASAPTESLSISNLLATLTGNEEAEDTHVESQRDEHFDDEISEPPHATKSDSKRSKPEKPAELLEGVHFDDLPLMTASFNSSTGQAWSLSDVAQLLVREAKAQEGDSAVHGFGGRSLGEVAQEILRLAQVGDGSDEHSNRSEDGAPHFDAEPHLEQTNDAPSAKPSMETTWEDVDGGEGRACRGLSKVDHSEMYFTTNHADSLTACKEYCSDAHSCVGLSYDSKEMRCEVWRRPAYIGMSVAAAHSFCLRYHGAATASLSASPEVAGTNEVEFNTAPASAAVDGSVPSVAPLAAAGATSNDPVQLVGIAESFEAVDGGSGKSCRGASPTDHADQYYFAEKAGNLGECQEMCMGKLECVGVEFRSLSGRCELWTRRAGIGASEEAADSECHRRLHVADTAAASANQESQPAVEDTPGLDIFKNIEKLGAKLDDRRDGTSDLMQELHAVAKELQKVEAEKKEQEEAKTKLQAEKRRKRQLAKKEAEKAKMEAEKAKQEAETRAHTILPGDSAKKVSSVIIGEVAKLGTKILDLQSNGAASSTGPGPVIFSEHVDYAFAGDDLGAQESMTLEEAKKKCEALSNCHGFNFQGVPASSGLVDVRFKSAWSPAGHGWSSFHFEVDTAKERKVREALANIDAAELNAKASADEQKAVELAAQSESASQASAMADKGYEFEAVDGGTDRACRGQKASDSFGWYYDLQSASTLDECKALCLTAPVCKGIEFNSEVGICEVWTRKEGIGTTEAAEGYECHRLRAVQAKAPVISETKFVGRADESSNSSAEVQKAWSDIKRLDLGFEAVDGGKDRACRGSADNDIKESYFEIRNATSLDECKVRCLQAKHCVGVDFAGADGQCKLWTRAAGIGTSEHARGRECHRSLGAGASFSKLEGYAFAGGEMLVDHMTIGEAEAKCASLQGCKGFTYEDATLASGGLVEVSFKNEWAASGRGWTSLRLEPPTVASTATGQQTSKDSPAQLAKLGSELFDQFGKISTAMAKGSDGSAAAAQSKRGPPESGDEGHVTQQAVQEMIAKALGEGGLEHHVEAHDQKLSAETVRAMISKALHSKPVAGERTSGRPKKHGDDDEDDEGDYDLRGNKAQLLANSWRQEEKQRKREQRDERRRAKLQEREEKRRRMREVEEEQKHRQAMQAEHERQRLEEEEEEKQDHKKEMARQHAKGIQKEKQSIAEEKPSHNEAAPNENAQDDDLILKSAMRAAEEAREALSKFQEDEVPTGDALKAEVKDIKKAVAAAKQAAALVSKSQAASKSLSEGDDATSARAEKITKIARLGTSLFKKIAKLGSRIAVEESKTVPSA